MLFKVFCYVLLAGNTTIICNYPVFGSNVAEFDLWRNIYNKNYQIEELSEKFNIWSKNKKFVNTHNSGEHGYTLELNTFADIPQHKWLWKKSSNKVMILDKHELPIEDKLDDSLPKFVDWREKDIVVGVKNQQQCGSCWAFSAVGSMEGQHALKTGKLVSLSESQIVDCDINGTDGGCSGGWMDGAFKYVINNSGIESEQDYPYDPQDDPCTFNKSKIAATFSNFSDVHGGEEGLKKSVASVGPISVAIDASHASFQFYKEGVYYEPDCSPEYLDHGVLVVGYGTTKNGTDYWIVKNSWGESWGNKGYIWMVRNHNNSCGIATKPSYPIV